MSFSFDINVSTDKDQVRLYTGDTDENAFFLHDETIDYLLTAEGSVAGATMKAFNHILTKLSDPDFSADWISVNYGDAFEHFRRLRRDVANELGVSPTGISATPQVVYSYRKDSDQDPDVSTYGE